MGNCWTGTSKQKLDESEKTMLKHSGISLDEIDVSDVIIDDKGNYIRTI